MNAYFMARAHHAEHLDAYLGVQRTGKDSKKRELHIRVCDMDEHWRNIRNWRFR